MPHTLARTKRVALQFSSYRVDVLLPDGLRVADALRSVGVDPEAPGTVVVTSDGTALDLSIPAGEVVSDGAVLHISAAPRGGRGHAPVARPGSRPAVLPQVALLSLAAVCGVIATLAASLPGIGATGALTGAQRLAVVCALLAGSMALALRPAVYQSGRNDLCVVTSAFLACGGGATAVGATTLADGHQLALLAGFVTAASVSSLAAVTAKRSRGDGAQAATALAAVFAVSALVGAVALFLDLAPWVVAAVVLSLVPPSLRLLPALALRVPVEYLVDAEHVMRGALSVRGGPPRPSPGVRPRTVSTAVERGDRLLSAGVLAVSAVAVLLVPVVLVAVAGSGGTVETVAAAVLVLLTAVALALVPRSARSPLSRTAPRAAAGITLLELVVLAPPTTGDRAIVLACVFALVGLVVALVSAAVARGQRWVRLSRLADAFEGLAVTLSIPAALVSIGTIELVRSAFSG